MKLIRTKLDKKEIKDIKKVKGRPVLINQDMNNISGDNLLSLQPGVMPQTIEQSDYFDPKLEMPSTE